VLETVSQNAECEGLDGPEGVLTRRAVGHDARQARDLCDPAAVLFLLQLDDELHALILPLNHLRLKATGAVRPAAQVYLDEAVAMAVPILPHDAAAAAWHGRERARLSALGAPPSFADGQIAAIAGLNGLTVVTANVNDFESFDGLRVESWRTAGDAL